MSILTWSLSPNLIEKGTKTYINIIITKNDTDEPPEFRDPFSTSEPYSVLGRVTDLGSNNVTTWNLSFETGEMSSDEKTLELTYSLYTDLIPRGSYSLSLEGDIIEKGDRIKLFTKTKIERDSTNDSLILVEAETGGQEVESFDVREVEFKEPFEVSLSPKADFLSGEMLLWLSILLSSESIEFNEYEHFMNCVICGDESALANKPFDLLANNRFLPFTDTDSYRAIKVLTETFIACSCGTYSDSDNDHWHGILFKDQGSLSETLHNARVRFKESLDIPSLMERWESFIGGDLTLPYLDIIRRKLQEWNTKSVDIWQILEGHEYSNDCYGILRSKLTRPCFVELIWSYWMEECMLVQGMNSITYRFQNVRRGKNDPLANLELDPLRPLNNLLWGYIQDEQHRLTVKRRAYEYDHHYGITLHGKAVNSIQTADSRSKFMEAFHNLLFVANRFFEKYDDNTISADGFPLLNALQEVHFILSEGAHNQYGDLPTTARVEMMMQQWLLSRPEMREFLPTRVMVAYPESWMDRVAAMNQIQGWTSANPKHFRDLAMFGERIILSIRFTSWSTINDGRIAATWANFWRSEIQRYLHAYRAVTGVDLIHKNPKTGKIDSAAPSVHLRKQLAKQKRIAKAS